MSILEAQAYKPYPVTHPSFNPQDLLRRRDYNLVPGMAKRLGFQPNGTLEAQNTNWDLYVLNNLKVPNFGVGATVINSRIAVVEQGDENPYAVMRISDRIIPEPGFRRDLEAFTRFYIERPKFFGIPSRIFHSRESTITLSLVTAAGLVAGGALAYSATGDVFLGLTGSAVGAWVVLLTTMVAMGWGEKRASKSISHTNEYVTGFHIENALNTLEDHIVDTGVKRELHVKLEEQGFRMTPERFVEEVYSAIPEDLKNKRRGELGELTYPTQRGRFKIDPSSSTKLLEAAKLIVHMSDDQRRLELLGAA